VSASSIGNNVPILGAAKIFKQFGGVRALNGVDVEIHEGQVLGLVGPNGSGKTTLFNVLSGFTSPSSGEVTWNSRVITRLGPHKRARLGLARTFQEMTVFPGLTVVENLAIAVSAAKLRRVAGWTPEALAEYVELTHVSTVRGSDLSWGQGRLLGIALCLALKPQVLLLDEPFAGLSPSAAATVAQAITRLISDGITLCIVDHALKYLIPLCDHLTVLDHGQTIADGSPDDVLADESVRRAYLGATRADSP
jgi:branched-chain amino acid transport system ATP-binding protein